MSSDSPVMTMLSARVLASRQNGARSRGPRTAAGKARSARNALKHGLSARKFLVLPEEDTAEFQALEAALLEELAPVGALQVVLAECVVSAAWRLRRADRLEAEVLEFRRAPQGGLGLALIRDGNGTRSFDTVLRYRNAAIAELLRAQKTLQTLQTGARAGANLAAAAPARRRRARPRVERPAEPEKRRQNNALPDGCTAESRHDVPDRIRPVGSPAVPPTSTSQTKQTQERASNQCPDLQVARGSPQDARDRGLADASPAALTSPSPKPNKPEKSQRHNALACG